MNTDETVARIDRLIGIGERMTVVNAESSGELMKAFCHGISAIVEEIQGFGNRLSAGFSAIDVYDPKAVEEGLAVLRDMRRLVLYAGEYGC